MTEPMDTESQRKAIIRSRNRVLALVLTGFAVLFFCLTIVKFPH